MEKREKENDSTHRVGCTCSDDRTPRSVTSVLRRPRTELAPKRPSVVEDSCLHCRGGGGGTACLVEEISLVIKESKQRG